MKTKAISGGGKSKKSAHVKFFVADDVRQEADGKVSMMGLYCDDVIVAKRSFGEDLPSAIHPLAFEGLTFVFTISGIEGEYEISAEIESALGENGQPSIQQILKPQKLPFKDPARSANLVVKIRPFITQSLGVKKARLYLNEDGFEFPFEIRDEVVPQTEAATSPN